jgi:hypothetical protein
MSAVKAAILDEARPATLTFADIDDMAKPASARSAS